MKKPSPDNVTKHQDETGPPSNNVQPSLESPPDDLEEVDQEGKITATTQDQSGKLRIYLIFFHTSYFRIFYCCH